MSTHDQAQPEPVMPPFTPSKAGRLVKLAIAAAFYLGRELAESLGVLFGRKRTPSVVAMHYHQVPQSERALFAAQMDRLLRWTVPIAADSAEPKRAGSRYAMVTADDGWLSFIQNALPELERRQIPVALFAITGHLGESLGQPADRLVTADELKACACELVTIGSHTTRHARLTALDERAAWEELTESRHTLEHILGRAVALFSFPFGAHNDALIRMCRDAGYRRVFLAIPTPDAHQPADFVVGRIRVDPTDWWLEFHLKLMDAYSWLPRLIRLKRWLLGDRQPAARSGRATSLPNSSTSTGLTR